MRLAPRRPSFGVGIILLLALAGCSQLPHRQHVTKDTGLADPPAPRVLEPSAPVTSSVAAEPAHVSQTALLHPPLVSVRPPENQSSTASRPITPRCYRDNNGTGYLHRDGDYVSITGIAEHLYVRNVWRIRYAKCDGDDPFDGSFTLADSAL